MEPHQTSGKLYPFLFTQCQAILARTLVPCQDTPQVKQTYTIEVTLELLLRSLIYFLSQCIDTYCYYSYYPLIQVTVPSPLVAVCSGLLQTEQPIVQTDGNYSIYLSVRFQIHS